jgi:SLT domain-containing protein
MPNGLLNAMKKLKTNALSDDGRAIVNKSSAIDDGRMLVNKSSAIDDGRALVNAYAKGTNNASKGAVMVGEKGKEIVIMKGGEKVVPNNKVAKYLSENKIKTKVKKKEEAPKKK